MKFRITIVLVAALGGLTAIAVATVLYVLASANIRNTLDLNRNRVQITISATEDSITRHLMPARSLLDELRRRVEADGTVLDNPVRLADLLSGALAPAPQLGGVAVWKTSGEGLLLLRDSRGNITIEHDAANSTTRSEAYTAAVSDSGHMVWSRPYFYQGRTFITIHAPLMRNGAAAGVAVTGIALEELSRFVRTLSRNGMTAFILYGDDRVLAHPMNADSSRTSLLSPSKPLLSVAEIGDPVLADFPNLAPIDEFGWEEFDMRGWDNDTQSGEPNLLAGDRRAELIVSRVSQGFGEVPWRIGVHIPADVVSEQIRRLVGSIAVSVGLLIASVAIAILLATRIARPIRAISAAASKVERLDLDAIRPLSGSTIREIDEQARSFNQMIQGLKLFQTYAPRQLVRRLMSVSGQSVASAREAELTVMFADIVGFTALSERMQPSELAAMLNGHFEGLNEVIEAHGGTVDKYIGDSLMAFWGAPEPAPDHAARACRAALAMAADVASRRTASFHPQLRLKIALHTGSLIVGNIGAPTRMNYTVIGDTVNVCSRIESLAAKFIDDRPVTIIASETVKIAAGNAFSFEQLGVHPVRGRRQTITLHRLVSETPSAA